MVKEEFKVLAFKLKISIAVVFALSSGRIIVIVLHYLTQVVPGLNIHRTLRLTPSTLRVGPPVAAGRPVRTLSRTVYRTGPT